jgi:hypothetical protein
MEPLRVRIVKIQRDLSNALVDRLQLCSMDARDKTARWEALDHLLSTPYHVACWTSK